MKGKYTSLFLLVFALFLNGCNGKQQPASVPTMKPTAALTNEHSTPSPKIIATSPEATYYASSTHRPSLTPSETFDLHYLYPSDLDDTVLAEAIRVTLQERMLEPVHGGVVFCAYILLMAPQVHTDGSVTTYLAPTCSEFYLGDLGLYRGNSRGGFTVMNLQSTDDGWLVDYQIPQGAERSVFPTQIAPFVYAQMDLPYSAIAQENIKQAETYFGVKFNPTATPVIKETPTFLPTQTSYVNLVPYTLTPTVDYNHLSLMIDTVKVLSGNPDYLYLFVKINGDEFNNRLTDFEKGVLFSGWHVDIFRFDEDGNYQEENALVLDHLRPVNDAYRQLSIGSGYSFLAQVSLDELFDQFGDTRNFFYHIVDNNGEVLQADTIYLTQRLYALFANGIKLPLVMGYPNAFSEDTAAYYPQEDSPFIRVKELQGGMHHLVYAFSFCGSSGITATDKLTALSPNLLVEIAPYTEEEDQDERIYTRLSGSLHFSSCVYEVYFPTDWMESAFSAHGQYYLRVRDDSNTIYHETFLAFTP